MLVGANVKFALPRMAWVVAFEAVITTVCWVVMLVGAVNRPLLLTLPTAGLSVQVTLTAEGRFTTANCSVFEAANIAVAGVTLVAGFKPLVVAATEAAGVGDGLTEAVEGSEVGDNGDGAGLTDPEEGWGAGESGAGDGLTDPVEGSGVEESGAGLTEPIAVLSVGCSKTVALAILVGSAMLVAEIVTKVSALTWLGA
jgi:hypothetical protein